MLRLIVLTLLLSALCAESIEINPEALPEEAQTILSGLEEDRIQAYQEYEKKVKKVTNAAIDKLKQQMKESTQDGDLEAALAVRAQIKKLENLETSGKEDDRDAGTPQEVTQRLSYRYTNPPNRSGGGYSYSDDDHAKLVNGSTFPKWERGHTVGWARGQDIGEVHLAFPKQAVLGVRVHVVGGHGTNVPAPAALSLSVNGRTGAMQERDQYGDKSGWVVLKFPRSIRTDRLELGIEASGGIWTMIDEIQVITGDGTILGGPFPEEGE